MSEYGVVATGLHTCVWLCSWCGIHLSLKAGLDVGALIAQLPYLGEVYNPEQHKHSGELLVSYLINASIGPVRGLLTIAAAPPLTGALRRRGVRIPALPFLGTAAAPAAKKKPPNKPQP
eukprot:TRINITY_DN52368_c0_g1_i1.p3 TRINITY_DN52368_c0_g1~~TRINITY_DN52368_c0_g1_i1.p3  ORF type:complete len:119 (+),score=26.77 TRINITY_DN52368_c0_g1_i1:3-359(+)